jgi:hypothetical protein
MLAGSARGVSVSPGVQVGTLTSSALNEVSGVVGSRSLADTLWVHNDAGDSARFFAISTAGSLLATYSLDGATAIDWEDNAIGPQPGGGNYLYLGDIGDNDLVRPSVVVYRVTEPTVAADTTIAAGNYDQATLVFPGGVAKNSESMFVDPWTGDLVLVTKVPSGQVFSAPASAFGGPTTTLTSLGTLSVPLNQPSAADISPNGAYILVRDRSTTAYLFERSAGQSVWDAMSGPAISVTLRTETQGEAIGWAADGSGFYITSEWRTAGPQPIYFYAFVPEPDSGQLIGWGLMLLAVAAFAGRIRRAGNADLL